MSIHRESADRQRAHFSTIIARQRGELALAYANLAKPMQYAEYGLRGFGFLRANPWVLTVVPAVFKIASLGISLLRNKPPKAKPGTRRNPEHAAVRRPKDLKGHIITWSGRGWRLFQLYRRIRKYWVP